MNCNHLLLGLAYCKHNGDLEIDFSKPLLGRIKTRSFLSGGPGWPKLVIIQKVEQAVTQSCVVALIYYLCFFCSLGMASYTGSHHHSGHHSI